MKQNQPNRPKLIQYQVWRNEPNEMNQKNEQGPIKTRLSDSVQTLTDQNEFGATKTDLI